MQYDLHNNTIFQVKAVRRKFKGIFMMHQVYKLPVIVFILLLATMSQAQAQAPWGESTPLNIQYAPQKVVYDVSASSLESFINVIDRASYLNNLYHADPFEASIVLVLHGDEIPFFAIKNHDKYREIMQRAQSLTLAGPIEFRMCRVAAAGHGFEPEDIHGFVKIVPMADAEIIRLQQQEGYVYMR
jgi:intracellular sulfur oxidation DsrE/DsrF family protein